MDREIFATLFNGAVYEIYGIMIMYITFETMLHIKKDKRKIFFFIFFLDMFTLNMIIIYLNYFGNHWKSVFIFMLQIINSMIYLAVLKIITEIDYLHILFADMIGQIIGIIGTMVPYIGIASLVGKTQSTLLAVNVDFKQVAAFVFIIITMTGFVILERFLLKKFACNFYKAQIRGKALIWGVIGLFWVSGLGLTAILNGDRIYMLACGVMIPLSIMILYEVSWWVRRRKEKQIKRENQILSIENAVMKEYYDTLDYQLERTRKFRHDIEKHMSVLKEMITSSENGKELIDYAVQIEEEYNYLQTIDYCGNPVVNAILVNKKHQCEEQNITLEIEIGQFETGEIKEIDLVAVISNLLDNAVEECQCSRKVSAKKIVFQCGNRASNLFLSVSNTTDKEETDIRKTWKEDTYAHGVGLSIVREIVEKYDGMFQMEIKDGMCEVMVGLVSMYEGN